MPQSALAGRHDAMSAALGALRSSARTGRGSVIVVSGEPGIGKSAVVNAVAQEADGPGSGSDRQSRAGRSDRPGRTVAGVAALGCAAAADR